MSFSNFQQQIDLLLATSPENELATLRLVRHTCFQLEKTLWAAEKDTGGGVLKSAQDFSENTVYSIIGL